jgi:hypothetical protein
MKNKNTTQTLWKKINEKNKEDLKEKSNKTNLEKRLIQIETELQVLNPESLLLQVDPSIEATQIIEQIQEYYNLILKEKNNLVKFYIIITKAKL